MELPLTDFEIWTQVGDDCFEVFFLSLLSNVQSN